jgi:hypothetical protein
MKSLFCENYASLAESWYKNEQSRNFCGKSLLRGRKIGIIKKMER